jgi:hypothetical protein
MKWKLKAGALQLTIFIVVVIALLLSSFLILVYTQKSFETRTKFVLETIENANQGIYYALQHRVRQNDTILINPDETDKQIKIHRGTWGIFERITSTSTIKNNSFQKSALVGASQPETHRTALYVEDNNKPLIVVGRTQIQGVAYLPKQGVRPGNISGESYYGRHLIYGIRKQSAQLPELLNEIQENINDIQQKPQITSRNQVLDVTRKRVFKNSFFKPVQLLYRASPIILSNIELSGHILVQSDSRIVVEADTWLEDIVLIAPIIEIADNVKGTFQAFASEKIIVGKNCVLNYPSAMVLKEKQFIPTDSIRTDTLRRKIHIKENSSIKGIVAYLGQYEPDNYEPQVILQENSLIKGEVYCEENLELNGNVDGSVYTANFILPRFGTIYQNHLYNSEINIDKLPRQYVGLLFENSNKTVAKWLY